MTASRHRPSTSIRAALIAAGLAATALGPGVVSAAASSIQPVHARELAPLGLASRCASTSGSTDAKGHLYLMCSAAETGGLASLVVLNERGILISQTPVVGTDTTAGGAQVSAALPSTDGRTVYTNAIEPRSPHGDEGGQSRILWRFQRDAAGTYRRIGSLVLPAFESGTTPERIGLATPGVATDIDAAGNIYTTGHVAFRRIHPSGHLTAWEQGLRIIFKYGPDGRPITTIGGADCASYTLVSSIYSPRELGCPTDMIYGTAFLSVSADGASVYGMASPHAGGGIVRYARQPNGTYVNAGHPIPTYTNGQAGGISLTVGDAGDIHVVKPIDAYDQEPSQAYEHYSSAGFLLYRRVLPQGEGSGASVLNDGTVVFPSMNRMLVPRIAFAVTAPDVVRGPVLDIKVNVIDSRIAPTTMRVAQEDGEWGPYKPYRATTRVPLTAGRHRRLRP